MSENLTGKPSPRQLEKLLGTHLGKRAENLLVGPGPGLDAAVLDIGHGQVMAIAEDPIFPAPNLPLDIMGWFTVHIGASDVAVTGIRPQYMTYTLLMPNGSTEQDAQILIQSISNAARDLDISIVGGHTGWYAAVTVPTVGGVTVWGTAPSDRWISPGGARDGDAILMTKGPGIEAAALLGVLYREKIKDRIESIYLDSVIKRVDQITVVEDALTAFEIPGVHAMHDATEGGVLGGLWEMHAASGISVYADLDSVPVPEDIIRFAKVLDYDPWKAISEGTLLAAVCPDHVKEVQKTWETKGIPNWILGRFDSSLEKNQLRRGGTVQELPEPDADPFWDLFFAGLK